MPTLTSIMFGLALSTAPTTPTTGVNQAVQDDTAAQALWEKLLGGFGRVTGEIVIADELRDYVHGKCSDFVVTAYKYPPNGDTTPRGTTKAYGNLSSGKCTYMLFVKPTRELSMTAWFEGGVDPEAPGDVAHAVGMSEHPKRVKAGKTRRYDFEFRPGWIG